MIMICCQFNGKLYYLSNCIMNIIYVVKVQSDSRWEGISTVVMKVYQGKANPSVHASMFFAGACFRSMFGSCSDGR